MLMSPLHKVHCSASWSIEVKIPLQTIGRCALVIAGKHKDCQGDEPVKILRLTSERYAGQWMAAPSDAGQLVPREGIT